MSTLVADRRLCLTADKKTVVEETDPRAAWLLVAEGRAIGAGDVARFGMHMAGGKVQWGATPPPVDPEPVDVPEVEPEPEPEVEPVEVEATPLPDDLPGRDAFERAGLDTLEAVRGLDDYTAVRGIGKRTAEELTAYFAKE